MAYPARHTFDYIEEPRTLNTVYEEEGEERGRRPSVLTQFRHALSSPRHRVNDLGYTPLSKRETRRCRRSYVLGMLRRVLLMSPVGILSMFGILHLLQFLIGRSHLFWDAKSLSYTPNWNFRSEAGVSQDVFPIPCHSHNDYWRREPLFDALSWGCTGVEADVWLFDEELWVGHSVSSLTRERTFRSLYVDKIVALLDKMNPNGTAAGPLNGVFDTKPEQTLTLLVDLKNYGREAFPVFQEQLQALREKNYLTYWNGKEVIPGPVTVVGTGDTPFDMLIENPTYRDIFFDAPLSKLWEPPRDPIGHQDPLHDLDREMTYGQAMSLPLDPNDDNDISPDLFNTSTSYYASTSFERTVGFVWRGHLSPRQMEIIRGQIRGAKQRGLKARYWNTPSWPVSLRNHVWHVLMKEGADVLNVDDLGAAARQSWTGRVHQLW